MGRSIPSATSRIERKIFQWDKFGRLLTSKEKEAYKRLVTVFKNRRTAISETDEPDIGVAMLLAAVTHLESELCSRQPVLRNGKGD